MIQSHRQLINNKTHHLPDNFFLHTFGGHYKIIESLGEGGFGKTFLAKDIHLPDQPLRVVKWLDPQSNDPEVIEVSNRLFNTEARVLDQLGEHSQIPQLFAHFQEDNNFYLVQEYIKGHDLSAEITRGKTLSETAVSVRKYVNNNGL